jgi:hypothetical protein
MEGVKVLVRFHQSSRIEIGTLIWLTDRLAIDHKRLLVRFFPGSPSEN